MGLRKIEAWGIIRPTGHILIDDSWGDEDAAWHVALGWPTNEEIEWAKTSGWRAVRVTVMIEE